MTDQHHHEFPIHFDTIRNLKRDGKIFVESVPWDFVAPHEQQAQTNHGQTLEHLADRRGLDALELLLVVTGRPWNLEVKEAYSEAGAMAELIELLEKFENSTGHLGWCPFCCLEENHEHKREVKQLPDGDFRVVCGCGALGPPGRTSQDAIDRWPDRGRFAKLAHERKVALGGIRDLAKKGLGSADSSMARVALDQIINKAARWL